MKNILIFLFGAVFLAVGIYISCFSTKGLVETTGVIDRIETRIETNHAGSDEDHDVYVSYTVDGQSYTSLSNVYSSSYRVGKEIKIFYDPNDPAVIRGDGKLLGMIFAGIGGIMVLCSIGSLIFIVVIYKRSQRN